MIDDVGRSIPRVAEEIRAIVASQWIGLQHIRHSMKCRRFETFLVDVGESAHRSAVTNTQQIEVVGMFAVLGQQRNRVESRTVVMQLPLEAAIFGGEDEIPVTARAAVVSPVRNRGIVAEDWVERYIGFVQISTSSWPVESHGISLPKGYASFLQRSVRARIFASRLSACSFHPSRLRSVRISRKMSPSIWPKTPRSAAKLVIAIDVSYAWLKYQSQGWFVTRPSLLRARR